METLPDKYAIVDEARRLGFYTVGCARAAEVDDDAARACERFIAEGRHGSMDYLAKYNGIRRDPRLLLYGARTVIIAAMSYHHDVPDGAPAIAMYAHGTDYHIIVRDRLEQLAAYIRKHIGGTTRVCVDTAPLAERYWALQAGIGFIGLNHQLIIPGAGSRFFLGAIITTAEFRPDEPLRQTCCRCRRCIAACPGGAIAADGTFDARKCLSYLTIEHRGDLPEGTDLHGRLYGCDACQDVCPHNLNSPATPVAEFYLRPEYLTLTPAHIAYDMTSEEFSTLFRHSPIKRAKLAGLRRTALHLLIPTHDK